MDEPTTHFTKEYTSEEKPWGNWIDGSVIYAKTIVMTSDTWTLSTYQVQQAHGISNIDKIVKIEASMWDGYWAHQLPDVFFTANGYQAGGTPNINHTQLLVDINEITIRTRYPDAQDYYVTIYYTKTSS